jgi:hypothetical protein
MDLHDVSDAQFGKREHNYLDQYGGKDAYRRAEVSDLAHAAASEEMLDEIHCMLRALCKSVLGKDSVP